MGLMQRWTETSGRGYSKQLAWGKAEEPTFASPGQQRGATEGPGRE